MLEFLPRGDLRSYLRSIKQKYVRSLRTCIKQTESVLPLDSILWLCVYLAVLFWLIIRVSIQIQYIIQYVQYTFSQEPIKTGCIYIQYFICPVYTFSICTVYVQYTFSMYR